MPRKIPLDNILVAQLRPERDVKMNCRVRFVQDLHDVFPGQPGTVLAILTDPNNSEPTGYATVQWDDLDQTTDTPISDLCVTMEGS